MLRQIYKLDTDLTNDIGLYFMILIKIYTIQNIMKAWR